MDGSKTSKEKGITLCRLVFDGKVFKHINIKYEMDFVCYCVQKPIVGLPPSSIEEQRPNKGPKSNKESQSHAQVKSLRQK